MHPLEWVLRFEPKLQLHWFYFQKFIVIWDLALILFLLVVFLIICSLWLLKIFNQKTHKFFCDFDFKRFNFDRNILKVIPNNIWKSLDLKLLSEELEILFFFIGLNDITVITILTLQLVDEREILEWNILWDFRVAE